MSIASLCTLALYWPFFSFKWVIDFNSEKLYEVNSTVHHINIDTYMKIRNIIIQTTYPEIKTENYSIVVNIRISKYILYI